MRTHIAYAEGSPCPTLVLDGRDLPREPQTLMSALVHARQWLRAGRGEHILKIASIQPSAHPMFDLDYRFFQAMPDRLDHFDFRGSCGHSVLSSVVVAARCGMIPPLQSGARIQVNVLNNGDRLVCDIDQADEDTTECTIHFVRSSPTDVTDLLITGEPRTHLEVDGTRTTVSLVSAGNPYVFIGGEGAGVLSQSGLFAGENLLLERLMSIRAAAARHLGWAETGAFPKVAVVLAGASGRVAARAVTVPAWHPTLALTGVACLAAASVIPGTIAWDAARQAGCPEGQVVIDTPGGSTAASVGTTTTDRARLLEWTSVALKRVTFHGSFDTGALPDRDLEDIGKCSLIPA
jgi:2-methylaconitate cis-trans-isomerase PrpF